MASMKYREEELNYFRVCKVTTCIIPNGLRQVFKQEWDTHHQATYGLWQDMARNGMDFYGMAKNKKIKSRELSIMKNGNTNEWDCTCLSYGILYLDSIKPTLNATAKKSVYELRKFRNEVFAHTKDGKLKEADFKTSIDKVITSFTDLKLHTTDIEEIRNQTSFPTEELEDIKKQLEKEKKRNEEPRPFCVLPAKPSHETVSRLNEVDQINEEMERLRNTKNNEVTVVYLSGNPGCGKSEVARQIGERFFDEKSTEMKFVMTVNASNIDTLLQSYVEFACKLRCDEESIVKISTSENLSKEGKLNDLKCLVAPKVEGYLSWLIVVDNVSDLKSVFKYWPQAGEKTSGVGQILVTTQDSSSIPSDPHTYHLSLKLGMNLYDAVKVLCDISGMSCDNDITLQVAKALDFQPLALACAAVYMKRIKGTDWTKYLQKLKEGKREVTEKEYQKTSLTYPKTMTAAVRMAVDNEASEDRVMRHAFEFLSVIAPEPIPLQYVVQYVMNCLSDEDEDLVASTIRSSSLVLCSKNDLEEVRVHQVVHLSLQVIMLNKDKKLNVDIIWNVILAFSWINELDLDYIPDVVATRRLVEHFTALSLVIQSNMEFLRNDVLNYSKQKHVDASYCLRKIRMICNIHGRYEAAGICFRISLIIVEHLWDEKDPRLTILLNDIGDNLFYLGNYKEAEKYLRKALYKEENSSGDCHLTIIATLNNIGKTLLELRRQDEAMKYVERALSIQKRMYGEEHPLWARTLSIQGSIFHLMGNLEQAKLCYEKALAIEESQHARERHTELNITQGNMGCLLRELGQLEESKRYLERAIKNTEGIYDEKHPALAVLLRNLGVTYSAQGEFKAALSCFQRVLDIEKRKYGEDKHPKQATTLDSIGNCLLTFGKYEESKTYFNRALAISQNVHSDDVSHPSLVKVMNNLACSLIALKQYKDANILLEGVLERQECSFEEKEPNYAVKLYNNLSTTLYQMQQHQESKKYLDKALAIQERCNNLPPETLAITFNNLGKQECKFGRYAKADEYYQRAVAIKEKICPSHLELGTMLSNRGEALSLLGKYEEANACLKRALSIIESVYDKLLPEQADTLLTLGNNSIRMQNYEEAEAYFKKAVSINESYYGKQHPEVADFLCEVGETVLNLKQYEECRTYFERALTIYESYYSKQHPKVANTLLKLGKTLFHLKQYEKGATHYERALSIKDSDNAKEQTKNATILHSLGASHVERKQYEQAVVFLEKSYAISSSFPEGEYPLLANTVYCLGISNLELERYKEAKIYLEKTLVMIKNGLGGETSRLVADIQDKLAIAFREEKKKKQKQRREQRQQEKEQRRDQHKKKYVNKRK